MAIIQPEGLFRGDRLRKCSQMAQLYWPFFYVASNTYGRLEINYEKLKTTAFANLTTPPTEEEVVGMLAEYQDVYLLFVYSFEGQYWGQWDTPAENLVTFKKRSDGRDPGPPEKEYQAWKAEYQKKKLDNQPKPFNLRSLGILGDKSAKVSSRCLVSGTGVGTGEGKEKPSRASQAKAGDERHKPVMEFIEKCCTHAGVPFVWEAAEGKQLSSFLKGAPKLTTEQVIDLVRARFRSKDPPGNRPRIWLGNLGRYATPEGNGHGGTSGTVNRAQQRQDSNLSNIAAAARTVALGIRRASGKTDGQDSGSVSEPDHHGRNGSGVSDGLGGDGNEVRSDAVRGSSGDASPQITILPPES